MTTFSYERKNRYYSRSRINEVKFRQIIRFFAIDFTASDTAKLTNISIRSINTFYIKLRKKFPLKCEEISPFSGVIEFDESNFGTRRVHGISNTVVQGRGASGKMIRDRNVYIKIVPDCSKATLQGIIRRDIELDQ